MRLGLQLYPKTIEQYLRDLGNVASDSNTQVYLDTNILGYLYKLHPEARKEFFSWTDELVLIDGRLFIPAWSANEYLAKFKTNKFSEYAPSRPEQVSKLLNNLRETASLFVDDDSLRKINFSGTRTDFLNGFDNAINDLTKFTCIFNQQFDTWSVHSEITSNLSDCILYSDLAALCLRAANEGDVRISHRLPPGFKDSAKPENKYGDLIIWLEILEHLKTNKKLPPKNNISWNVLFVSNDEKPDWVYAPQKRNGEIKGVIKEVKNADPEIKIPDPRLVAEFHSVVGHSNIHITTLPMLIRALSVIKPKEFENLASAIQIESGGRPAQPEAEVVVDGTAELAAAQIDEQAIEETTQVAEVVHARPSEHQIHNASVRIDGVNYPADALRDGAYEADAPGVINEIIRALRSQNWYTQNPAIEKIKEIRQDVFKPSQWFVLGRNIYQAACGNAQKALEFLKNLDIELARLPDDTANHLLSGMVFEVYFNRDGNFRSTPKASHIEQILREICKEKFVPSKTFILAQLTTYAELVPFKPGDENWLPLSIEILEKDLEKQEGIVKEYEIQTVNFLGEERICGEDNADLIGNWSHVSWSHKISAKEIKSELSSNYVIPEWAIRIQLNLPDKLDARLRIPKDKALNLDRPPLPASTE
jgi:predicted nucleic acid-binding protein